MNFHEDIKQYHPNITTHLGYAVVGNYFRCVAHDSDGAIIHGGKFSDYEKVVNWVNNEAKNAHTISIICPIDSDDLANRKKLNSLNTDSKLFQFLLAPRQKKFSIKFFSKSKNLKDVVNSFYPEGDDITYAPALQKSIKNNYTFAGSCLEINFDDKFHIELLPFFSSQPDIELNKVIISVDNYEEALMILEEYDKGK